MSELRQDPTTRGWVIVAAKRARRPHELAGTGAPRRDEPAHHPACPFCPGHEDATPAPTLTYTNPDGAWQVRVVPNRYPLLSLPGSQERRQGAPLFRAMDGVGVHEVIVETPDHRRPIALMDDGEVELILRAYRERYRVLRQEPWAKVILIFRNHGPSARASLEHPHSQLITTPVAPLDIRERHAVAMAYYDDTGRCLYRDLVEEERRAGHRVVLETESFVVFTPFASQVPFETWITPKTPLASFGDVADTDLQDLAGVLKGTLARLYRGLGNPDLNYVVHSALVEDEHKGYHLWHLRILPRLVTAAGFELGTGIAVNTVPPEEAAAVLRQAGAPASSS